MGRTDSKQELDQTYTHDMGSLPAIKGMNWILGIKERTGESSEASKVVSGKVTCGLKPESLKGTSSQTEGNNMSIGPEHSTSKRQALSHGDGYHFRGNSSMFHYYQHQ